MCKLFAKDSALTDESFLRVGTIVRDEEDTGPDREPGREALLVVRGRCIDGIGGIEGGRRKGERRRVKKVQKVGKVWEVRGSRSQPNALDGGWKMEDGRWKV